MERKHTPEPWFVWCGAVWTSKDGADGDGSCVAVRASADSIPPVERDANMHRIVACVNACRSMDTGLLERINMNSTTGISPLSQERRPALEQQRDELLAALKGMEALLSKVHDGYPATTASRYADPFRAAARAAITNAESEK